MNARIALCCTCCCLLATQATAWCCDPEDDYESFDMAEYVPADVTTYVNVCDGARLRSELAEIPLGSWLTKWTVSPDLVKAWTSLAVSAQLAGTDLFDTAFGEAFTLVVRGRGADAEWAIISKVDAERTHKLLRALRPRLIDYWRGMPVYDLPEHQLIVSRHDDTLLIGPRSARQRKLFETVCRAIVDDLDNPLEDDAAFEEAAELGSDALFVFVRHDETAPTQPGPGSNNHEFQLAARHIGPGQRRGAVRDPEPAVVSRANWTAFTGALNGRELSLRHASSKPIFEVNRREGVEAWDMAPLAAISEHNVLALIKSVDQRDGLIDLVVEENLGGKQYHVAIRDQQSGRRILVVDEPDGSSRKVTVAQALELGCDEASIRDIEATLKGMNINIRNLDRGAYLVQSNPIKSVSIITRSFEEYGHDEVSAIFSGLPVMEPMPLEWTVAAGPTANWCIMSNDHGKMVAMATALSEESDASPEFGTWVSCGSGDGRRLAETLHKLAVPGMADQPFAGLSTRQSLGQITNIASVVDQFNWTLAQSSEGRLTLSVKLRLAKPAATQSR